MEKYVSYIRVSTQKQNLSGLGLQSQLETVNNFVRFNNGVCIAEFKEIESGKNDKRPELLKALEICKKENAILVVAKLDRLSRNLVFTMTLRDSNIKFVCCDMPDANNLTIGVMALLAEQERIFISSRTKNALKIKKDILLEMKKDFNNNMNVDELSFKYKVESSVIDMYIEENFNLGKSKNLNNAYKQSLIVRQNKAYENSNNKRAFALIESMKNQNLSYRVIANKLNDSDYKTSKNGKFSAVQVKRIYDLYSK